MSLFVIPKELIKASKVLITQCQGSDIEALAKNINKILRQLNAIDGPFSLATNAYSLQEKARTIISTFKALKINEANYKSSKNLAEFFTFVVGMFGDEKYSNSMFANDVFDIAIPTRDNVSVDLKAVSKRYLNNIQNKIKQYDVQNTKPTQSVVIEPIKHSEKPLVPKIIVKLEEKKIEIPQTDTATNIEEELYEEIQSSSNKMSRKLKKFPQEHAEKIIAFFNELSRLNADIDEGFIENTPTIPKDSNVGVISNKENQKADIETLAHNLLASNSSLDDANTSEPHWTGMKENSKLTKNKHQMEPEECESIKLTTELFVNEKKAIANDFSELMTDYLHNEDFLVKAFNERDSIQYNDAKVAFKTTEEVKAAIADTLNNLGGYSHDERFKNRVSSIESIKELVPYFKDDTILIYDALINLAHAEVMDSIETLYFEPFQGPDVENYHKDRNAFLNELNELAGEKIKSSLIPHALEALQEALDNNSLINGEGLQKAGKEVYVASKQAYEKGYVSEKDLPKLVQFINGTTAVINDPKDINTINRHQKNTEEVLGMNRKWTKLVASAMLCFLGVAFIGVSIAFAIGTFGGSTPLSAAGFVLGCHIIGAGFGVGVGMAGGVGLVALGGLFANSARKGSIALVGEQVRDEAAIEKNSRI
jgi:hypothetical protein